MVGGWRARLHSHVPGMLHRYPRRNARTSSMASDENDSPFAAILGSVRRDQRPTLLAFTGTEVSRGIGRISLALRHRALAR